MLLTMLLASALQPGAAPAAAPHPCAPRPNLTAAAPPPPLFSASRIEQGAGTRVALSVDACPEDGHRVELRRSGPRDGDPPPLAWVPVAQCAPLSRWIEAAARLRLPAPMLRPHADPPRPMRGTWFVLTAGQVAGRGSVGSLEMHVLEPPGAAPNALSAWFGEGERLFQACRAQGHGGEGYAPWRPRPPRPRR